MSFYATLARLVRLLVAAVVLAGPPAHVTTHNRPDGRCHEDMICWGRGEVSRMR